jgi:hypothetical protein
MKQLLLAIALIAAPVGLFAAGYRYLSPAATAASFASLGDLASLKAIVADVQTISTAGDLKKAGERVTDFETAWDDAEPTMRSLNPAAWGNIDEAADGALKSLRAADPDAAKVSSALTGLMAKLDDPYGQAVAGAAAATMVDGIAVSGPDGRPQPCEDMIKQLEKAVASAKLSDADAAAVAGFKSKALERCNADDDLHADEFSARAIAISTR